MREMRRVSARIFVSKASVNSLEVERDTSKSPLIRMHDLEDDMRIENDPSREQEATSSCDDQVGRRAKGEEDTDEGYSDEC